MDDTSKLAITKREKGSKGAMHKLRSDGFLPCSISQRGKDSISFSVVKADFRKAYVANGLSGIYQLREGRKKALTAMIREIQYVPGSSDYLHITFQGVSLTEETTADIALHIKGREELQHNGLELQQQMESLHLKGLPTDFPSAVDIDVSQLQAGDTISVADVTLPDGITCLTEPDHLILSVHHPKVYEEPTEAEEGLLDESAAPAADGAETAEETPAE